MVNFKIGHFNDIGCSVKQQHLSRGKFFKQFRQKFVWHNYKENYISYSSTNIKMLIIKEMSSQLLCFSSIIYRLEQRYTSRQTNTKVRELLVVLFAHNKLVCPKFRIPFWCCCFGRFMYILINQLILYRTLKM